MPDKPTRFWDRVAEGYSKRPVANQAVYEKKLEITRAYFRPDMEVFEFGCGTGSTAVTHAPHVKYIQAIDVSSKMVGIAKKKAAENGVSNVTFLQSTIEEWSVGPETYDLALGLSILHLLEDKEAAIGKVHGMLKPGGVFATSTVCLGETMKFFKFIAPIGKSLGLMPLVKVFTPTDLENSLTNAGFTIDHKWQPGKGKAVFIVAKKAG